MDKPAVSGPARHGIFYAGVIPAAKEHRTTFEYDSQSATRVVCVCGYAGAWHPGDFGAARADQELHLRETRKLAEVSR